MTSPFALPVAALLEAQVVAVIGVSRDPARLGTRILSNAVSNGFRGRLYGVGKARFDFDGARIVTSIDEIPGAVDLALLAVPADGSLSAIEAMPAGKCRVVVAIASGFAEIGARGEALEARLRALCLRKGIALIGPNCQGVVVPRRNLQLTFSPMYDGMPRGPVAIVAQSGAMGGFMANRLMRRGVGVSAFISSGNETVLNIADYVTAFGEDPQTRVILAYLEQIRDGRRFCAAVRRLPEDKTVLVVKSGRSPAGVAAVRSHTGSIAGDDAVVDAVLAEIGAVRMADSAAAVDAAAMLAAGKRLKGKRIGVLSIAGGLAVETTDLLELAGLEVPSFDAEVVKGLQAIVPEFGATRNPVDLTGAVLTDDTLFERALALVASDAQLDGWIVISTFVRDPRIAKAIIALDAASDRPLAVCWTAGEDQTPESLALLRAAGIPVFDSPARTVLALAAMHRRSRAGRRRASAVPADDLPSEATVREARQMLEGWRRAGRSAVHEADSKRWLQTAGIAVPGRPGPRAGAVVKICADSHLHKSEYGLVSLNVAGADVPATIDGMRRHAQAQGIAVQSVLVEEQVGDALLEWIVGLRNDDTMGPVVVVGAGGIHAELFGSARIATLPIAHADALALLRSHPAFPVIDGARGRPVGDSDAFAGLVCRAGNLFAACADLLSEVDLNPVVVRPVGARPGAVALDAALILAPAEAPTDA